MRMTGPFPVSVPQGGQATNLQWEEECYHLRMIEVQHKRCLEEAQLENDTAGEGQQEERAPDPSGRPASHHTVSPDPGTFLPHMSGGDGTVELLGARRGCWEKLGDQMEAGSP